LWPKTVEDEDWIDDSKAWGKEDLRPKRIKVEDRANESRDGGQVRRQANQRELGDRPA
jgi:hypothetical protein